MVIAFLIGVVLGGALGYGVRLWLDGRHISASPDPPPSVPPSAEMAAPASRDGLHICALVDATDRVISYRQVASVPPEFTRYHGRGANKRFIRDGEDAAGHPRFRLVV